MPIEKWGKPIDDGKLRTVCGMKARELKLTGKQKDEFVEYCFKEKKTNMNTPIEKIYKDFMKTYSPEVEGKKFDNLAALDTMPLDAIRIVKRFREYASTLGKEGKLIINTAVLAELIRHGTISPIVSDKGEIIDIAENIVKKIKVHPEIIDNIKSEIASLINTKIEKSSIKPDNIEIVSHNPALVEQFKQFAKDNMDPSANEFLYKVPYTDKSIIATMIDEKISLLIAADQHFDNNIWFWKQILNNPKFQLLSQKTLGR